MIHQIIEGGMLLLLFAPLCIAVGLGLSLLLQFRPSEQGVKQLSAFYFVGSVVFVLVLFVLVEWQGQTLYWSYPLFKRYKVEVILSLHRFALIYLLLSSILMGLVGRFSFSYLHREEGFHRFFVLLHLATFGIHLILMSGCLDVLWMGWECLGVSSILLVAFFRERKGPVQNSLYIFVVYRISDLALLAVGLWLHTALGTTHYQQIMTPENLARLNAGSVGSPAFFLALLLVVSAVIKAGLFPFLNWLPRAMEGPTPSSAIFYGALSTHIGVFLLIQLHPMLRAAPGMLWVVMVVGALSALLGSLFGRIQADAKNSLAYSTIVQLGLIFVEIGLGWLLLAQIHLLSHAILRSYQFLKVPSVLHIHHEMISLYGREFAPTGFHWERWLPMRVQRWLYFVSLEQGFLERFSERFLLRPLYWIAHRCNQIEEKFVGVILKETAVDMVAPTASRDLSGSARKATTEISSPSKETIP